MTSKKIINELRAVVEAGVAPEHILSLCDNAISCIEEAENQVECAKLIQQENVRLTGEVVALRTMLNEAVQDFKIIESCKNHPLENRPCGVCRKNNLYCSSGGAACKGFVWRGHHKEDAK